MAKRWIGLLLALVTVLSLAVPAWAESGAVEETSPAPVVTKLAAPELISVSGTAKGVTVTWYAVPGAAQYRVFYKTDGGNWKKAGDTQTISFTWTKAKSGTSYSFTVRCLSADGQSYTSAYDPIGLRFKPDQLATPEITSVTAKGKAVTVKWGKVDGAAAYRLFYWKNGKWTKLADTTGTSVTKNGTPGRTYTYTVRCISKNGKSYTSSYDPVGKSITLGGLATPHITSVTADEKSVTVRWGKVDGAAAYRLFYWKNGKWTKLADTTDTSLSLDGDQGRTYIYTVRCISADGTSYTSSYDPSGRSLNGSRRDVPELENVASTERGVLISWGAVDGTAKYRVFYKTDGGNWKKAGDTEATLFLWTGAKSGKNYRFTVRCLSADGGYTSGYDPDGLGIRYTAAPHTGTIRFTTAKGFQGVIKNGVTYIEGYLVANKTYALPKNYGSGLTGQTQAAFRTMAAAAAADGLNIYISSGFRSYSYQNSLYNSYVRRDGAKKADTYSARAGHSEHQSGLAFDVNIISDAFIGTPEAIWLADNCYEYGFILRYPQGKSDETGYKYEPWHFRYVGTELAQILYNDGDWITMEDYFGITSEY